VSQSDLPCPAPTEGSLAERAEIVAACVTDVRSDNSVDARVRSELNPERRTYLERFIARAETVLHAKFPDAEVAINSIEVTDWSDRGHLSIHTAGQLTIDGIELKFSSLGFRRNPQKNTSITRIDSAHGSVGGHAEVVLGRSTTFRSERGANVEHILALTHQAMEAKADVVTPPLTPTIQKAYRSLAEHRGASALFADVLEDGERRVLEGARRMVLTGMSSIFGDVPVTVDGGRANGGWHAGQLDLTIDGVPLQARNVHTYFGGFMGDNHDRPWRTELTLVVPGQTDGAKLEINRGRKGTSVARHIDGELPLLVWKAANAQAIAQREAAVVAEASAEVAGVSEDSDAETSDN